MKYGVLCFLLFVLAALPAQTYLVAIPVQELIPDEVTYALLTNEAGKIIDDYYYSPYGNDRTDTIRLRTTAPGAYHLTVITNYLPIQEGVPVYTTAVTYYGLQEDYTYRAPARSQSRMFAPPMGKLTQPIYEIQGLKFGISRLLLPTHTTLQDKQFRLRQEVATIELRDQREDEHYLFFQRGSKELWRYHLHRPETRITVLQYEELPEVNQLATLRLPLFETWQLDLTAYHPYLDARVGIPITENPAGVLKERDLALYIPEMDILTDYLFAARMRRPGERYTQVFRGNVLPATLERVDPFFTANLDPTRLSVKVSGPAGYFVLNGLKADVLAYPGERRRIPRTHLDWKIIGAIPATGHVEFQMPVFRADIVERIPNLRKLGIRHFTHCSLLYLKQPLTTALWAKRLVGNQDLLRDYGGTLITKDLRTSAQ